jgi:mono/diheme cytochrome c family protein
LFSRNLLITTFFFFLILLASHLASDAFAQEDEAHAQGRIVYEQYCALCHGVRGDGQGPIASLFQTKPRNFIKGEYKIKSTPSGSPPLDADLLRSVKLGLPGTAMTSHAYLSDEEIRAVVSYIKTFSSRFSPTKSPKPLVIPLAPPPSPERVAQGRTVYQKSQCIQCHGPEGKGNGVVAEDLSIKPTDLTSRPFKGGSTPQDIARIILTGIEGTPMSPYQFIFGDQDLWDLAYYIASLSGEPQQTEDERKGLAIVQGLQKTHQEK